MAACGREQKEDDSFVTAKNKKKVFIGRKDLSQNWGIKAGIFHHWSVKVGGEYETEGVWYEIANPPKCGGGEWYRLDTHAQKLIGCTGMAWECSGENQKWKRSDDGKRVEQMGPPDKIKGFKPENWMYSVQRVGLNKNDWNTTTEKATRANVCVGTTTKSHADIKTWSDNWIKSHPNYTVQEDNCQKYAVDLMDWLTNGKAKNVPPKESPFSSGNQLESLASSLGNSISSVAQSAWKSIFG